MAGAARSRTPRRRGAARTNLAPADGNRRGTGNRCAAVADRSRLGDLRDYLQTGVTFRFGQGLDSDFGVPRVRPGLSGGDAFTPTRPFAWYVFAGADGQAVGYDMLLQSSPFRGGPHVSTGLGCRRNAGRFRRHGLRHAPDLRLCGPDAGIQRPNRRACTSSARPPCRSASEAGQRAELTLPASRADISGAARRIRLEMSAVGRSPAPRRQRAARSTPAPRRSGRQTWHATRAPTGSWTARPSAPRPSAQSVCPRASIVSLPDILVGNSASISGSNAQSTFGSSARGRGRSAGR